MVWREQRFSAQMRSRVSRGVVTGLLVTLAFNAVGPQVDAEPAAAPNSQTAQTCTVPSHFGRMFSSLAGANWSLADVDLLATRIMAEDEATPTPEGQVDDEENAAIDSGFTYVGQFIDHDLTLDDRPNDLTSVIDPTTLLNKRTPAFD